MLDKIYFDASKPHWKGNLHMHTTRSDGKLTPEEMVEEYKKQAYDFVCLSDHEIYWNDNALDRDDFLVLGGTESSIRMDRKRPWLLDYVDSHTAMHFGCIMDETQCSEQDYYPHGHFIPRMVDKGIDSWNKAIRVLRQHGNLVIVNHPDWSRVAPDLLLAIEGCFALEIWNSGNVNGCGGKDDEAVWDYCLQRGKRLYAVAGDDAHGIGAALCTSFIGVAAEHLDKKELVTALKNGEFYASTGPEFKDIRVEDGVLKLQFSPVKKVFVVVYDGEGRTKCAPAGEYLTEYAYPLKEKFHYVRAMIQDEQGRMAWAQPVFIDELLGEEEFSTASTVLKR